MRAVGRSEDRSIIALDDALAALGDDGYVESGYREVPLRGIVGTAARSADFDIEFRPLHRAVRDRQQQLAAAVLAGKQLPPVELVQLGEMYFVRDGHHRVSVARSLGWPSITAWVRRSCTIAFGEACLRLAHLPSKAAERVFLERVPLPDEVRKRLWLVRPDGWARLGDAAESWGYAQLMAGRRFPERADLARAWWTEEVQPVVAAARAVRETERDVQLYAAALLMRDRQGLASWPCPLTKFVEQALSY
ncbi:ParB N-terminal domain-containing protein [Tamaricihabitans halophyticus]|uniref:ParB N-terminal domain-containing protein n=1 Tax=Tamaricihabitans halophyticus TaxID=1262583 RepID=UPI0014053467|nr:ParB N-terminal domain-containing protein [Tamaricihabitans halophyticus]